MKKAELEELKKNIRNRFEELYIETPSGGVFYSMAEASRETEIDHIVIHRWLKKAREHGLVIINRSGSGIVLDRRTTIIACTIQREFGYRSFSPLRYIFDCSDYQIPSDYFRS
jgi:DNA-binding transcriptional ArsR family regulator